MDINKLTIKEIKEKCATLDLSVNDLLRNFQKETGCDIKEVSIHRRKKQDEERIMFEIKVIIQNPFE